MSKAKKIVKKAVSTVFDPFKVGYGDVAGDIATGDVKGAANTAGAAIAGTESVPPIAGAPPVAPIADDMETARRKERELARRYAGAGRAGTSLSEGSKLG